MEVRILGKPYAIRSDVDADFTNSTADLVNDKMRELAGRAGGAGTEKVAVLAAMNLAGELLRLKSENAGLKEKLQKKTKKILDLIDDHF